MERPTILIVDDDPDVRESYTYFLEDAGYRTLQAESRSEALNQLQQHTCHVALLDMKMEGESDGILLNQTIREQYPEVETVIVTAYAGYSSAVQALKDGAVDYLSKASSNDEILRAIRQALERRLERLTSEESADSRPEILLGLVCNHSFLREGMLHFTAQNPIYQLEQHFRNIQELTVSREVEPVDIIMICASCNFPTFSAASAALQRLHLIMPDAVPVLLHHHYSMEEKAALLELGVKGFLPDELDEETLLHALTRLMAGEVWAGRAEISMALDRIRIQPGVGNLQVETDRPDLGDLTPRERDVLRLLALDYPNKDIASKLGVSERTIKTHLYNIYQKMGVHTRTEAVQEAYNRNILP